MALINFKIPMILIFLSFTCQAVVGICKVDSCNDQRICVKAVDRITCKCRMGLYDDLCASDAKITVNCTSTDMTLSVAEGYFVYYNTPIGTLHLPDKDNQNCDGRVVNNDGFFVAKVTKEDYSACGGKKLEKNDTHIIYSLSLQSEPQIHHNIVRDPIIKIEFKCIYPYKRLVSLPFAVLPYVSEAQFRVDELDATIQMMLYTDDTYTSIYTSAPTIELLDTVYVQVKVTYPEDFFNIRLNECWATQTKNSTATDDNLSHMLLEKGCVTAGDDTVKFLPLDPTAYDQSGSVGPFNGMKGTVHFSFQMFRFRKGPQELFLHCSLVLCEDDPDHREACNASCPAIPAIEERKKREVATPGLNQGLLSFGPIKVGMSKPAESSGVMQMVALPVAGICAVGSVLLLLIALAKTGNRRLRQSQEGFHPF